MQAEPDPNSSPGVELVLEIVEEKSSNARWKWWARYKFNPRSEENQLISKFRQRPNVENVELLTGTINNPKKLKRTQPNLIQNIAAAMAELQPCQDQWFTSAGTTEGLKTLGQWEPLID